MSNPVFAPLRGWYDKRKGENYYVPVFAPLRGWYENEMSDAVNKKVFAPLRGWYAKYITEYRKMEELNA